MFVVSGGSGEGGWIGAIKIHIYSLHWNWQLVIADGRRQERQIMKDLRAMFHFRGITEYYTCTHSALTRPPYQGLRAVVAVDEQEHVKELFIVRLGCSPQRVKKWKTLNPSLKRTARCELG